ncbi:MAG: hypothetical protein M3Q39_14205 [Actinomycetota bacterium]|nr:hypothetical protein [Actinomycetota bacterium]
MAGLPPLLQFFDGVLSREDKTARAERLIRPILVALVVTILGITAIITLPVITLPWWTVAAGLAATSAAGGGIAVVRARRAAQHAALLNIPRPREAAEAAGGGKGDNAWNAAGQ